MNPLNPRNVKDYQRYEEGLRTEFAKQNFWRLQNAIGHKFWSIIQDALETNSEKKNKPVRSLFSTIARVRKLKAQNEWKTQLERKASLKSAALADLAITSLPNNETKHTMTEADLLPAGHNVRYVTFGKRGPH